MTLLKLAFQFGFKPQNIIFKEPEKNKTKELKRLALLQASY